jgi:spoIIIJ-associated protein
MKYVIKESKTVEDAVREALNELDKERNQVEIEVLEEPSKGLFGFIGGKDAKVKISVINDVIDIADKLLDKVLESLDIEAKKQISKDEDILNIIIEDIDSSDKGIVIGKRGNTLDAIQYLVSLAINKENDEYIKVLIDVEGYREKRKNTLIRLANKMADKAIYGGRLVKLEPMNPYERRIIHSSLQDYKGVKTYSEGKEPYRRIVIAKKEDE